MSHEAVFPSPFGPKSKDLSVSSFRRSLWLSPALFAIHAVEDSPNLADWMRRTQLFEPVSRGQLIVALSLLLALSCLCAYAGHTGTRWGVYALVWMQGFIFLHGVSHLISSVWLLEYTPGLVTGLLLLPLSYFVYRHARNYCYFGWKTAAVLLIAAVLLYDPVLRLAFKAGSAVIHEQHRPDPSLDRALGAGNVL
jgi:hypothetical protein